MHETRRSILALRGIALALAAAGLLGVAQPAAAQRAFPTPEAAADAMVDGVARHDGDALEAILGAGYRRYVPVGVSAEDVTAFLEAWARGHRVTTAGDKAMVEVGRHGWTLPIPIVRQGGSWRFDMKAGAEEIKARRIGRNEIAAVKAALAYADAQEDYASADWDGDGVKSYALKLLSTPGKRDGLYWAELPDEPESPLGAAFADASPQHPYHGYVFRILTAQGSAAPGGAKNYVKGGRLVDGYALVASPAKWGDTGVMSFIVSKDGVVYEKNLGANTAALARGLRAYDPDASWKKVDLKPTR